MRRATPSMTFWFQFQTGSIKRIRDPHRKGHRYLFQFQTGSIKRKYPSLGLLGGCSFNSKLVRLKVQGKLIKDVIRICFNSKLVRLKGYRLTTREVHCQKFQFQTGSIKSVLNKKMKIGYHSFNSKLVRLKAELTPSFRFWDTVSIPNWFD